MELTSFKKLMEEIGFNENASYETKKAYLMHLFKTAAIQEKQSAIKKNNEEYEQLNLFEDKKAA